MKSIIDIEVRNEKVINKNGELWQWDRGQKLRIFGTSLKHDAEIHFSLVEKEGVASVARAEYDNTLEALITDIPDVYLSQDRANSYKIFAFIYVKDEKRKSGQTKMKIILNVKARPKPKAYDNQEENGNS